VRDDLELARRCREGDAAAFETLYRAHAGRLFGLLTRMTGSAQDAEDLLQDVFVQAHRKLALFRGESSLGTWLYRMAVNQCLDHLRGKQSKMARTTDSLRAPMRAAIGATVGGAGDLLPRHVVVRRPLNVAVDAGDRVGQVLRRKPGQRERTRSLLHWKLGKSSMIQPASRMTLRPSSIEDIAPMYEIHRAASYDVVTTHQEVCCPSSWASPMRIPSGPRM